MSEEHSLIINEPTASSQYETEHYASRGTLRAHKYPNILLGDRRLARGEKLRFLVSCLQRAKGYLELVPTRTAQQKQPNYTMMMTADTICDW